MSAHNGIPKIHKEIVLKIPGLAFEKTILGIVQCGLYMEYLPHTLEIQSPCQMMIGVYNHLLRKVFWFHSHSQKVIGSLGIFIYHQISLKWLVYIVFICFSQHAVMR